MWRTNLSKARFPIALAALAFPLAASAQFYASAAVGTVRNDVECHDRLTKCDTSDSGFKLIGGYRFTPLIAAEATYFDLGKAAIGDPFFDQEFEVSAFALGAALHGDFTPSLSWVARAGIAQVKVEMTSAAGALRGGGDDTSMAPYLGAGVSYRLLKQLSLDLSLDLTEATFERPNNKRQWDVAALWLGVSYAFGR